MNTLKNQFTLPSIILALGIVVSVLIGGLFFYKIRTFDNTLSVVGSTRQKVTSDSGKLTIQLQRVSPQTTLSSGYASMASDLKKVTTFLTGKNINASSMVVSPVSSYELYDQNKSIKDYQLSQTIEVSSNDVYMLDALAKEVPNLTTDGLLVNVLSLEFYYSELPTLRVNLLENAIADAKARAEKLALSTGSKVGKLKSAGTGVVQVLSVNSVDISDYGTYDTSKIEKEVVLTVKATFVVN